MLTLVAQALSVAAFACVALLVALQATRSKLLVAVDPAIVDTLARAESVIVLAVALALLVALSILGLFLARRYAAAPIALFEASRAVAQGSYDLEFDEAGARETRGTMRNLGRVARSFDRLETARRTWLVSVSEELRAPIGTIVAKLDEIADRAEPPQPDEFMAINDSVKRLAGMAEDLHAVALADLGRLPVTFAAVDPIALIHNAIWANSRHAEAQKVTLAAGKLPPSTMLVKWDGPRIEQLFTALIENSLRYTPPGGIITLGLEGQRSAWRLIIDDSAPGVDVEMAQRLFEPFYRTTSKPGESVTSSGLGLATAQAIVEAHHGRIGASRSPIGGMRITVILPSGPPPA